jgi:hypothetical protein
VTPDKANKAENSKLEGELDTTGKGLLHFNSDCWKKMDNKTRSLSVVITML